MIRAIFLGTPEAAVPALRRLSELAQVALVITRPDRPRGRSGRPRPSEVAAAAAELGLPVRKPAEHRELREAVREATVLDVAVVVAFGMIIPAETLFLARQGFLNVHFSLLPRWRGAAPVRRALLAGDTTTGVTVIRLDQGLDTGPMLGAQVVDIGKEENAGELTERLSEIGARLLGELMPAYMAGQLIPAPQPSEGVTIAAKVRPEEARLDLNDPVDFVRRVRAFSPRPGAYASLEGVRFKVLRALPADPLALSPGELRLMGGRLMCGVGSETVELLEVVEAGRRPMTGAAWVRGRRSELGVLASASDK